MRITGLIAGFLIAFIHSATPLGAQTLGHGTEILDGARVPSAVVTATSVHLKQFHVEPTATTALASAGLTRRATMAHRWTKSGGAPQRQWLDTKTLQLVPVGFATADGNHGNTTPFQTLAAQSLSETLSRPTTPMFDVDHAVATMLEEYQPMFQQRGRTRQRTAQSGNSEVWKWVGAGMMVVGGLAVLNGVVWCPTAGIDVCTGPLVVGGAMAGGGWYIFNRNR